MNGYRHTLFTWCVYDLSYNSIFGDQLNGGELEKLDNF